MAIHFDDRQRATADLYGNIANTAAILGKQNIHTAMLSEAAEDPVGDQIVDTLRDAAVDTSGIDRFTEGATPIVVYMGDDTRPIRYENYGDECFDIIWPVITDKDIVIFGGYYTLDERMRARMTPLLDNAAERNATMIYLPGFLPSQAPRITRIMPAILDNLERADIVVTEATDLQTIFADADPGNCYRRHIRYSAPIAVNVTDRRQIDLFAPGDTHLSQTADTDIAHVTAHIAQAIIRHNITRDDLAGADTTLARRLLSE